MDHSVPLQKLAEQGTNPALQIPIDLNVILGIVIAAAIVGILVFGIIQAIVCLFLVRSLKVVPPQLRLVSTGTVWLLMIPFFSVIWNFFTFPKIAKSLKRFADSQANYTVGDCGESLGWTYCGLMTATIIPYLGTIFGLAAFVVMIVYLVQIHLVASRLRTSPTQPATDSVLSFQQTGHGVF